MAGLTEGGPEKFGMRKVFSDTFSFIGRNLVFSLAVAALFFALPVVLVDLWASWYWPRLAYLAGAYGNSPWTIVANVGSAFVFGLLVATANFVGHAVLARATIEDINGKHPSIIACVQTALHHLLPVLGIGFAIYFLTWFVRSMRLGSGLLFAPHGGDAVFVLLIVPVIVWGVGISVAIPVAVREEIGVITSMSRSRTLTSGYRWPIFGMILIVVVGLMLVARMALGVFAPVEVFPVLSAIVWTVMSIGLTTTYAELRRIKEGTDFDDLAEIFA